MFNSRDLIRQASPSPEKLGLESARIATETLAMVGLPACVVDRGMRPLAANDLFGKLTPSVAIGSGGRVYLANVAANDLLEQSVEQLDWRATIPVTSIPIPATTGLPALILHLVPIRRSAHGLFAGAFALIVATTLSTLSAPPVALIAALFDLTPSEARAARGLVEGKPVSQLATELGWSAETVRTYLKSVFRKTGVHRQAELVSLLAGAYPLRF